MMSLIPSIERRLSAWETIQSRLAKVPEPRYRPALTLSRSFGCEGFPLAERLQMLLSEATGEPWNVYDKALVEKVSSEEGISLHFLTHLGDATRGLDALGLVRQGRVTHDEAFDKVAKALVQIAAMGNAIIVGRGGAVLCRTMPTVYHFRLDADLTYRVASIERRLELPRAEAEAFVHENSRLREGFIRERLGVDPGSLELYDAVFNNARQSVQVIADSILAYVRQAWPHPGLFKAST